MHAHSLLLALATLALSAPSLHAGSDVWTVDNAGSADFTSIQAAVNAAGDGDLILVRPGTYQPFSVAGKSLALEGQGIVRVDSFFFTVGLPAISIVNLAADQAVTMRGIDGLSWGTEDIDLAVRIANCAGPVLVEDGSFANLNGRCIQVFNCASVSIRGCFVDAGRTIWAPAIPGYLARPGLLVQGSNVEVRDSIVYGSRGIDTAVRFFGVREPAPGGPGIAISNSTLHVEGCEVTGGQGGAGLDPYCHAGEDGGNAITLLGGSSATVRDTFTLVGPGGLSTCGLPPGSPGVDFDAPPGTLTLLGGTRRTHVTSSPVTEGTSIGLELRGVAGDVVLLVAGVEPLLGLRFPQFGAMLHVAPPLLLVSLGIVPAGGTVSVSLPIPLLGLGSGFQRYVSQALVLSSQTEIFASAPSTTIVLPVGL